MKRNKNFAKGKFNYTARNETASGKLKEMSNGNE